MASTRVDSWIWAVRLTKTRSAAGAACRGGHVRVNDTSAKPAQQVAVGDRVQVRLAGHERVVEVTKVISKRVSAPAAAECYIDHSPPPPPRELVAGVPRRDRGAGRPTKRERRDLEKFRGGTALLALAAILSVVIVGATACSSNSDDQTPAARHTPEAPGPAGAGPFFGECGGVSTDEVSRITNFGALKLAVDNPSVCEWSTGPSRTGAVASFNWYRGSPIGRERGTEQLSRASIEDIDLNGHKGFIASDEGICEIGIEFGADFFEWSVSAGTPSAGSPPPGSPPAGTPPSDPGAICNAARQLSTLSIERAK
ncbi:DUF3558 family protein [Gordonia sp. DT30]|uniref:DUF3558 family protein n=1 Tax=unclassified Gordonia (in: high G+C Gram-positive bacteria) TaxID=2657482 RepID=UPI003CF1F8B4